MGIIGVSPNAPHSCLCILQVDDYYHDVEDGDDGDNDDNGKDSFPLITIKRKNIEKLNNN